MRATVIVEIDGSAKFKIGGTVDFWTISADEETRAEVFHALMDAARFAAHRPMKSLSASIEGEMDSLGLERR